MPIIVDKVTVEGNAKVGQLVLESETTAISLNGVQNLTSTNKSAQFYTGAATGFSIVLPNATTLDLSQKFELYNQSTQTIVVKDNAGTILFNLASGAQAFGILQTNGSAAGGWVFTVSLIVAGVLTTYSIVSSTTFSTSSTTDVLITGFSANVQSGTYFAIYSASVVVGSNNAILTSSIYKNGALITDSSRQLTGTGANVNATATSQTISQWGSSQAADVRVRISTGTVTVTNRSLLMIRTGP